MIKPVSIIYLTPASISYLAQFILSLAISVFLALRLRNRNIQLTLLTASFSAITIFIGLLFLDATLAPYPRLFAVYAENTILAFTLVFLLQFAYRFPSQFANRKIESYLMLGVSLAYMLYEALYAVYRYIELLDQGTVDYRQTNADYALAFMLLCVPIVFLRQSMTADTRPIWEPLKLWNPQGAGSRGAREFALIYIIPFVLGYINIKRTFSDVSTSFYNISLSIGILITLWLFASRYVNFIPGGASILAKLSAVTLTLFLAMIGTIGWIIAPAYIDTYRPNITDHQTLRFAPNSMGGYDVTEIPFYFETDLGEKLPVTSRGDDRNYKMDFTFSFYGTTYSEVYVTSVGLVKMGSALYHPNLQYQYGQLPAIFALLIDLEPDSNGGVFARATKDRLTITWDHLPSLFQPDEIFTFQVILYRSGVFDVTYNGLPSPIRFNPDATPSANPWVRGVAPGRGESLHISTGHLPGKFPKEQQVLIENYQLDFRQYLHRFILPLGWVMIGGSLLLMLALPLLLQISLIKPLDTLLAGVRQMDAGDLKVKLEIQNQDEIGFLTKTFNKMAFRLDDLVMDLEDKVSERTLELSMANEHLQKLSIAVEQSPSSIVITDTEARIEYINASFTNSTGFTFEEVEGKNPRLLKSTQTRMETYTEMWGTILSGHIWRGELVNQKKNGEIFWEYTVIAPIHNQDGKVTHYVAVKEDITERKHAEQELKRLAITDSLTGLFNRRHFFLLAEQVFARANTPPYELALLMIDIDHFKHINDQYGHAAGDECLRETTRCIQEYLRPTDIAGRYGGEEFIVLLPRVTTKEACQIADRICSGIAAKPIEIGNQSISITVSIGVAEMDETTSSLDALVQSADKAMYEAKHAGRNRFAFCPFEQIH
jgi:diguanylate cyclase (GGDEF)-like protein/PAS domain S-box-containing protein